tara:strand:+ start:4460 stop:4678 length:219 start_codon:yes stop_codon:yes gene_type:complete
MNVICTRWTKEIIKDMDGTFSAQMIKEKLVEKHGTNYIGNTVSIAQYLTKNCIVVGKQNDRLMYKRRVKPNE